MAIKQEQRQEVVIQKLDLRDVKIMIRGTSPLLQSRFTEKAEAAFYGKKGLKVEKGTLPNAYEEAMDRAYKDDKGFYLPKSYLIAAIVGACRFVENMKMTQAKGFFHILEDKIYMKCTKPVVNTAKVKNNGMKSDIRYRPQFDTWSAVFTVKYNAGFKDIDTILNLLNVAGFACGLGDNRVNGYGRFAVVNE